MPETEGTADLVLLRHGHSTANGENTFTGWLDVPLSERGREEAVRAGRLLAAHGLVPAVVHTSVLTRAVDTARLVLAALGRPDVPVHRSWRLNERHYGALQGRSRTAVREELGPEAFRLVRRSYDHAPPPAAAGGPAPEGDADPDGPPAAPRAESLADVRRRLVPYWDDALSAELRAGRPTLVVAHSNSLRALCMHLDGLTPGQVAELNVPTGVPLWYRLDERLRPLTPGGVYLDPAAAATGIAEVVGQGCAGRPHALTGERDDAHRR